MFEIWIPEEGAEYAAQAAAAVFTEIDRLDRLFNRFDPSSEIARLGRLRPGERLPVGVEMVECLETALSLREATAGAFAIDYATLVQYPERNTVGSRGDRSLPPPGFGVERTPGGFTVFREPGSDSPVRLDLGGIGKGLALDRCVEILADWSIENALLHGGTSTALGLGSGPEDDCARGWPVGFGESPGGVRRAFLRDRSMSGSGREVKGEHVTDPRRGEPAAGSALAWAAGISAAESDALSTAFLVMSPAETERFCRSRPDVWARTVAFSGEDRIFNPDALETE